MIKGLEIALAADIRIAADDARFGVSAVTRGGLPFAGGTQRLPRNALGKILRPQLRERLGLGGG